MREVEEIGTFDYFYYANPSTERANVLSYLEMEKKEDYREDLFFLRYCYSEGFLYTEDQEREKKEIYQSSHSVLPVLKWGEEHSSERHFTGILIINICICIFYCCIKSMYCICF